MIEGVVNADYEPVITLHLLGPAGQTREVEMVVDTGFNGFLTLPSNVVAELGLPYRGRGRAILANGSQDFFNVWGATVVWDGRTRYVPADEADATPLVGMALMDDYSLYVEVRDGGRVAIQPTEGP